VTDGASSPHGARIDGLDGLRALAVIAVVAFHLRPAAVPGGFLGVSLFFTLSGYLIVGRLADERERDGGIDLRGFWGRRIRRLLPASLLTLALVAAVWQGAGWSTRDIGSNLSAALLDVANWFQIVHHVPYGVSADSSPVLHFWSLAIEEQAYLLLPLVALCCRRRSHLVAALIALLLASAAATAMWAGDATVVYYSTATRVGEIVLGGLLAVLLARWRPRRTLALTAAGSASVVLLGWLVMRTSLATAGYYRGGLLAVGAVSAIAVMATARSTSLGRVLGWAPLALIGQISYGIYLFHWPILVGLRQAGVTGWRVDAITVAATLAAAMLSYSLVEQPIRRRTWRLRPGWNAALAAAAASVVLVVAIVTPHSGPGNDIAAAQAQLDARLVATRSADPAPATQPRIVVTPAPTTTAPTTTDADAATGALSATGLLPTSEPSTEPVTTAPAPVRTTPLRIGFFGDSQGVMLALGLSEHPDPRYDLVAGGSKLGCAIGRGGEHRASKPGLSVAVDSPICDWSVQWPDGFFGTPVDVAVVYSGAWDVEDRRGDPLGSDWTHIGEPAFDDWLLGEMRASSQVLLDNGARTVVWLTINADPDVLPVERYQRFNQLLAELDSEQGPQVQVIDLAGWIDGTGERDRLLPDHRHLTIDPDGGTAYEVADRYLLEQLAIADGQPR
jgi:peptidoglycan/LPS O-acetylase OafA/YrhL